MTDRPILFSGAMVRAILEGRKTQTRRVLKSPPPPECGIHYMLGNESWLDTENRTPLRHTWEAWGGPLFYGRPEGYLCGSHTVPMPYAPGDRLWVRETWAAVEPNIAPPEFPDGRLFRASWPYEPECKPVWKPSIHMPRWASRLTLVVKDVRVQRLQEIGEADAQAEGVLISERLEELGTEDWPEFPADYRDAFHVLWDSLNAKRGYGWDVNPWVVAVTFTPHKINIDQMPQPNGGTDGQA